jgi:hypothetical protein
MADIEQARSHDDTATFLPEQKSPIENNEDDLSIYLDPSHSKCPPSCSDLNEVAIRTSNERIIFLPKPDEFKLEQRSNHSNSNSPSLQKVSEEATSILSASLDSQSVIKKPKSENSTVSTPSVNTRDAVNETTTTESPNFSSSDQLKWEPEELLRLRSWITCVCLVDFDLSMGQTMKFGYPSGSLTESEGQNVASLAFPDSHSTSLGSYNFCFRFRATPGPSDHGMRYPYLFGYVFFCQKPDSTIDRGYFQKSLVLVSHLPYTHLFLRVVEIMGPLFFQYGHSILEASCLNIKLVAMPNEGWKIHAPDFRKTC